MTQHFQGIHLPSLYFRILIYVYMNADRVVPIKELISVFYGGVPDRAKAIKVGVTLINKKIKPLNVRLDWDKGRAGWYFHDLSELGN